MTRQTPIGRVRPWFDRWGPLLPILAAEFIVWLGFGALLPVLPIYFTDHGVGLAQLGLVIAAWPIARLVGEPIFGWIADRTARIPMMVVGLLLTAVACALPLLFISPLAFILIRAAAGLATSVYDPAARGFITDSTPPERRGEAFGLYGAAQMGGLLLGPAIGAAGADRLGGIDFVFVFSSVACVLAAIPLAVRRQEGSARTRPARTSDVTEFPPEAPSLARTAAAAAAADVPGRPAADTPAPTRLWNRGLIAALVINAGGYYAGGTYEVIWSLFLTTRLGASLDLVGLTFAMFGLPVLLLSPWSGRYVDRRGALAFIVVGSILPAITGILYTRISDPVLAVPLILVEATGFAMLNPALYAVVAANSPPGRSSTAQGIFGAAGTVGFVVASLTAGVLAASDILYPIYVFSAILLATLCLGLVIGRGRLSGRSRAVPELAVPPTHVDRSGADGYS